LANASEFLRNIELIIDFPEHEDTNEKRDVVPKLNSDSIVHSSVDQLIVICCFVVALTDAQ
jgi:hypothetical protein